MSQPEPESGDIFHIDNFRKLVELMRENDLSEVDMRRGDTRIRLRRGSQVVAAPAAPPPAFPAAPSTSAPAPAAASTPPATETQDDNYLLIRSEMVGSFYSKPNPDAPSYVKVGDRVGPETTVCLIEAMKTYTEVPAGCSGVVMEILVKDGEPVDVNKPLFKINPHG